MVIAFSPAGDQQGDITLAYNLVQVDGSGSNISLQFSTDSGSTWWPAAAKGGDGTTGVKGFRYPGIRRTIVWDSIDNGIQNRSCRIRITASRPDGQQGPPDETEDFIVYNPPPNLPPTVAIISGPPAWTNDNTPTFTFQGTDSDGSIKGYFVSIDTDPPDIWTLNNSWTSPELICGSHTFRVMAQDNENANSSVASLSFSYLIPENIYVDGVTGDDLRNGRSWATAVLTIQKGLDLAGNGTVVNVADGTYTGTGNKDLDFGGRGIFLTSLNGSDYCTIDCQYSGRGVCFDDGETSEATINGISIVYGNAAMGGGIYFLGSNSTIINCRIKYCYAEDSGGGIYCRNNSNPTIIYCTIDNNSANGAGGGATFYDDSNAIIKNCQINRNQSTDFGGGIWAHQSRITVVDCIIDGNFADGRGGGIRLYGDGSSGEISNCTIINNISEGGGAGINLVYADPLINGCIISFNNGHDYCGAGIYCDTEASPTILNCVIENNFNLAYSYAFGGGIHCYLYSDAKIVNCVIAYNRAGGPGGGLSAQRAAPKVYNCTITGNEGRLGGGVSCYLNADIEIVNSIIWNNYATQSGHQLYQDNDVDNILILRSCDFADNSVAINNIVCLGAFNWIDCINQAPQFLNEAGGNFRLDLSSPCIDTGNNALVPVGTDVDLDGNPRIVDGVAPWDGPKVDMGAYEYQP